MGPGQIIALVVLGYVLLRNFVGTDLGGSLATTATGGTDTSTNTPTITLPTITQLLTAVNAQSTPGILYSSDQWCYAFMHATGLQCPSNSVVGPSMTATQFLAAMQAYIASGVQQTVPSMGQTSAASSAPITGPTITVTTPPAGTRPPVRFTPGTGVHLQGLSALADCQTVDLHHAPTGKWEM